MDGLSSSDVELISTCLRSMGWDPLLFRGGRRLAGGSGSAVYRLCLGEPGDPRDSEAVLKVTTAPDWRARAVRELRFLSRVGDRLPVSTPSALGQAISTNHACLLLSAHRSRAC